MPEPISAAGLAKALSAAGASLTEGGTEATPPSAAAGEAKAIESGMSEIRDHLRKTGAALGAAATLILAGLGWAQVHQAFPLPAGRLVVSLPQTLLVSLLVGIVLGGGAVFLVYGLLGAKRDSRAIVYAAVAGAALAALLLAVLTAEQIGGSESVDLSLSRTLAFGLGLSSLLAVGGAAWLASRFFGAQRRILISTEDGLTELADDAEQNARDRIFEAVAAQEGARTLYALELRALRFGRIARSLSNAPQTSAASRTSVGRSYLESEAKVLTELVNLALWRAALWVLEYRSKKAFDGWQSKLALSATVVGLVGVFGIADYAKGERDLVDLRAKCQKAVAAGAVDACGSVRSDTNEKLVDDLLAQKDAEREAALADARKTFQDPAPPVTATEKAKWLEACVIVLREDQPDLKPANLAATCLALMPA